MNENLSYKDYLKQEDQYSEEINKLKKSVQNDNRKLALLYNSRGLAKYMQESFDLIFFVQQRQYNYLSFNRI